MFTKVFVVCMLMATAFAAPQDVIVAETPEVVATAAPAAVTAVETTVVEEVKPAVVPVAGEPLVNTCHTETEPLETQTCTPRHERVCTAIDVVNQKVGYEKRCKDVVSRICPQVYAPFGSTVLVKREADPAYYFAQLPQIAYAPTAFRSACHEVTTQHCIDSPIVVDEPTTVESCHVVARVDCVPVVEQIPKTVCDPIETIVSPQPLNPLAYSHHVAAPFIGL